LMLQDGQVWAAKSRRREKHEIAEECSRPTFVP
jgi:hypothetical protein